MTDAERRLWQRLRLGQLGVKFRRQHPLGPYVLDFACLAPKLAIEVDGSQHLEQVAYDARRSAWLGEQGYAVQRFDANAVLAHTDAVVQAVINRVNELRGGVSTGHRPPPQPSPNGGG